MGRDMECKVYGTTGVPVLYIPCQDGHFYDFENFHMTDVFAPWIENGMVQVFAVDTIDSETWSSSYWDKHARIRRHEDWMQYLVREALPFFRSVNGTSRPFLAFGCSLGALHAANLFFRFPDYFGGVLALSGLYSAEFAFDGYMDDLIYLNSPLHYLANMPEDHPYIAKYNRGKMVFCVGRGAWEDQTGPSTAALDRVLRSKGIHAWVDYWGSDVAHDWDWWYRQVNYFLPKMLED